jgi:hypothetical protein
VAPLVVPAAPKEWTVVNAALTVPTRAIGTTAAMHAPTASVVSTASPSGARERRRYRPAILTPSYKPLTL